MIVKPSESTFKGTDWCVPHRCPCLTCELWNSKEIEPGCACLPCTKNGLKRPEDIICWKTCEDIKAFDKKSMRYIASRKKIMEVKNDEKMSE